MRATKGEIITPIHEDWLSRNHNANYSAKARHFIAKMLAGKSRERKASFSASSIGTCMRAQQFTYLGVNRAPLTAKQVQIFHNGAWMHLRWQAAGLSAGWLKEAEVKIEDNAAGLTGTMDGVLSLPNGIAEFKSINSYGYASINSFGIKPEHNMQIQGYMYGSGTEFCSVIYENKDTQDWREYVVKRDEEVVDEVKSVAERLWMATFSKTLIEPKSKCIDGEGFEYNSCPYRRVCLEIKGETEQALWNQR